MMCVQTCAGRELKLMTCGRECADLPLFLTSKIFNNNSDSIRAEETKEKGKRDLAHGHKRASTQGKETYYHWLT